MFILNLARLDLRVRGDTPGVVTLVFHSVLADQSEASQDLLEPYQLVTVDDLRRIVELFERAGFEFVTPERMLEGEGLSGRYAMLTFDDGYANNLRLLPVLERFNVPATIFVSTRHVRDGKAFWWDVIFRERRRRGTSIAGIRDEIVVMTKSQHQEIETHIRRTFGASALDPISDLDRPMTTEELKTLARHPLIHLGNHTADHAVLTNYEPADALRQITEAQDYLEATIGKRPVAIAYPNGDYSDDIVELSKQAGLRVGFTCERRKNMIPIPQDELLVMGRFSIHPTRDLGDQTTVCRSRFHHRLSSMPHREADTWSQ